MEGKNQVTSEIASRDADIADHTHKAPTWDKDAENVSPDLLQLRQKRFIILNMAQLVRILVVAFQIPIRGRGHDKMDGAVIEK
jgi:hypothetical protein